MVNKGRYKGEKWGKPEVKVLVYGEDKKYVKDFVEWVEKIHRNGYGVYMLVNYKDKINRAEKIILFIANNDFNVKAQLSLVWGEKLIKCERERNTTRPFFLLSLSSDIQVGKVLL